MRDRWFPRIAFCELGRNLVYTVSDRKARELPRPGWNYHDDRMARGHDALRLGVSLGAIAAITWTYAQWLDVSNAAIVSTTFLLVVLLVAAAWRLWTAIVTSIAAMLCINFFFLPPVGTLTIADPQNWAALFAFLAVSLVASHLSAVARARTQEAISRRDELTRLFDLSRDVLMTTDSREAIS